MKKVYAGVVVALGLWILFGLVLPVVFSAKSDIAVVVAAAVILVVMMAAAHFVHHKLTKKEIANEK